MKMTRTDRAEVVEEIKEFLKNKKHNNQAIELTDRRRIVGTAYQLYDREIKGKPATSKPAKKPKAQATTE